MAFLADRIYLSPPRVTAQDEAAVVAAMRSGWLAPLGPELTAFECDVAEYLGVEAAVGLSSGTAGIHLGLRYLGVAPKDVVIVPTTTFAASAFPITYLGADPVFVDIDDSWNIDPEILSQAINEVRKQGRQIRAVIPVDLYGNPANYDEIIPILDEAGIPFLEDAAEGLGARSHGGRSGSFGSAGILSFNGNKIITTSGGGMLVTNDLPFAEQVRFWASQSRDKAPWYEHSDIGYNYRLSNLLAALGRSQFQRIDEEAAARRLIRDWYRDRFADLPDVRVQDDPTWGTSNAWLTVVCFSENAYEDAPTRVREHLEAHNIESRPTWKPMHQQPVFSSATSFLNGTADRLFREGLCLPSGTAMTEEDLERIAGLVEEALGVA